MKKILRSLLFQHLHRPKSMLILLAAMTVVFGLGVFRIEKRMDLTSLLPTDHPIVKASLQAGVGQYELLWAVAEGSADDLGDRRKWADGIIENLLENSSMPLNGIDEDGHFAQPVPLPESRDGKGASLWPPILAAGSLLAGDGAVGRMLTEHLYAAAPMILGDNLRPLEDQRQLRERFSQTAKALRSPEPMRAKLAQLDPLNLRDLFPNGDAALGKAMDAIKGVPLEIRTGYLETKDSRYVLVPFLLNFPNGETAATARILAWIGNGCGSEFPISRPSFKEVGNSLMPNADRAFPIKVTGAHAIAYWESTRLGKEVAISLFCSFLLICIVYWVGFRTLAGYGFVVAPLLLGMFWALGLAGWLLERLSLMSAAFGAVLLGVGDDVGILIFSRYRDERASGKNKALSLRAALLSTGPGVIAAMSATTLVFLACLTAPFPGLRDLGLTAGLGILCCMASTFLLMPPMLLAFDHGKGTFAPIVAKPKQQGLHGTLRHRASSRKAILVAVLIAFAAFGIFRLKWEEDLRKFRQDGNPALELQENLAEVLGTGIQPLALQIALVGPRPVSERWNNIVDLMGDEGILMPRWESIDRNLAFRLGNDSWVNMALGLAEKEGLDPAALKKPLLALNNSISNPEAAPRSLAELLAPPRANISYDSMDSLEEERESAARNPMFSIPIRLSEQAQDKLEAAFEDNGARLVGTRPLFKALKAVAKESLLEVIIIATAAILAVVAFFGRRWLFVGLALAPVVAGQIGVLGTLGWTGQPLTFLSLVAIPVTLGVSVDTVFNLLNRARYETHASEKVSRVNAVCAGTTLAGFGGLAFSAYKGLQGLGIAAIGGTALALLATQWLVPWILRKAPLLRRGHGGKVR
ncbi:MAG: MMPL family transporter [Holophagales bacterium]|jgi:predicted RND superfamily exporter protein|nr:MMPL family transporter [Holophagales bacterium]